MARAQGLDAQLAVTCGYSVNPGCCISWQTGLDWVFEMEAIITFFTPYYHQVSIKLVGVDITAFLAEKTGLPWWRVHEHVIGWLSIFLLLSITLNIILGIKWRRNNA